MFLIDTFDLGIFPTDWYFFPISLFKYYLIFLFDVRCCLGFLSVLSVCHNIVKVSMTIDIDIDLQTFHFSKFYSKAFSCKHSTKSIK